MPEAQTARRVSLEVRIDGHDVAGHFAPYLLEFSYTDNAHGKADEIQLSLHNRDGRFTGPWRPRKGMRVEAVIVCHDWEAQGAPLSLPCGMFKIDEIEYSGPPDKIQIKAVSADLTGPLRESNKTRAWEQSNLEALAGQIAQENNLTLHYAGPPHPFERQDQRNESDLAFLNRLANERGMNCKAHNGSLVLVDMDRAEAATGSLSIAKAGSMYSPTSWSFKISSSGTDYKQASVAYTDPRTGDTHTAEVASAKATDVTNAEKKLTVQKRAETAAQAATLGKSELHKANAREQTGSLECLGCPRLGAGQMLELTGFGDFSGRYFVKTATHKVSGSGGYTSSFELTTPAPTRDVAAHDEVSLTAEAARAGAQAAREERRSFERLCELVQREGTKLDKLLVCLPEIAAAMAERTKTFADRQGWLYLHEMFLKWFSGPANSNAENCKEPFWVDWNWVMGFPRIRHDYDEFVQPPPLEMLHAPNVRNWYALESLGRILKREGFLTGGRSRFDFINAPWQQWEDLYYTLKKVNGLPPLSQNPDGLTVALNAFSLRALASGSVEPLNNGNYLIKVEKIAVFVHDTFNFAEDIVQDIYGFGYWSCRDHSFSIDKKSDHTKLGNEDFRAFRSRYNNGENFLLLSSPHIVENFGGESYEYS